MNPRYAAFSAAFGDRPMWVYVIFISCMKSLYQRDTFLPIADHDDFTRFIELNSHKFEINRWHR